MLQHRGCPRLTTRNEDWYLAVTAKTNRRSTASDLSRQLSSATGTTVSRHTVYRRLGHIGLYARRSVRCVPHTATQCVASDKPGVDTTACGHHNSGLVTDQHVQSVTMTGHIYRDVYLEQHVRLFRGAMCAEFLFMDNNARPHRANIVDECLQSEYITRMD
ncbi:transposable element Tcb1 transposase [Trichonephila clavipes]|nr:transposable element Tcb1 transposase [Trichonephila clavipes]